MWKAAGFLQLKLYRVWVRLLVIKFTKARNFLSANSKMSGMIQSGFDGSNTHAGLQRICFLYTVANKKAILHALNTCISFCVCTLVCAYPPVCRSGIFKLGNTETMKH